MSLKWDDKTLTAFFENTKRAILKLNGKMKEVEEKSRSSFEVSDEAIRGIVEQYVGGEGSENINSKMSKFEQTAESIRTEVKRIQKSTDGTIQEVKSQIVQLADNIKLEVTDGSETGTASIVLKINGKEAGKGTIDMSGIVKFKSFLNDSETMIDGGKIETEALFAKDIYATGKLQIKNTWWSVLVGDDNSITMEAWKALILKGGTDVKVLSEAGNIVLSCMQSLTLQGGEIVMQKCPTIKEDTMFSATNTGIAITASAWQSIASVDLPAGTYIVRGTLTVYHTSAYYITSIQCGSTEVVSARNTVTCNGGGTYLFGQSVAFITLTAKTTVSLTVYGSEDSSYSQNTGYIDAIKIYN